MAQLKSTNVTGNLSVTGNILASKIIKLGGTADEILLANGGTATLSGLGAGTVTSVGLTVPTGLTVAGSPITGSGTFAVTYTEGYAIPTTADQTKWNTAHGWGNHANAGYLTSQDLNNYATKDDIANYLPLAGNTTTTLMTGSIKYGGKTQEIISIAPEYQGGSWKGGMKYSWDSKTTIALWGKNADCQFVWHAGADLSTGATDGWTNRNYDFQIGRNSSSTLEALLGGKPLATQEWVTTQLGTSGSFDLSKYTEGAASSTDNAIVRFDGTGGKKIQNSTAIISDAGHLTINTTADTTMTTPAIHVLHTGPVDAYKTADLMILSGYSGAPYGFKFSTHGSGTAIIQSQRISGGKGEKFPLSLNPDGGDVLMNGKLIATQEWVTDQLGSGGSGGSGYVQGSGTANCIPRFTDANTIGDSVISQAASNKTTIGGKLVVNAGADTSSGNCDEGIRILPAAGWAEVFLSNDTSITGSGGWLIARRGSAGTTSGAIGDFTIEYGGWQGTGLTLYANGNRPTWNNNELAYKSDFSSSVYDSKVTITTDKSFKSGAGYFTLNQSIDTDISLALNSSAAGNRAAETVVIAAAEGQIDSMQYTITNDSGVAKASWKYNASTDCIELAWA